MTDMGAINISLKGLTSSPSDYACADGEIAFATNMVAEEDGIRTVGGYENVFKDENFGTESLEGAFYIHRAGSNTVYIMQREGKLRYYDARNKKFGDITKGGASLQFSSEIKSVTHVGTTLIILDEQGMHYLLLKAKSDAYGNSYCEYKYLGQQLPSLDGIQFALKGTSVKKWVIQEVLDDKYRYETKLEKYTVENAGDFATFTEELQTRITNDMMGDVNKAIAEEGVEKNRFIFPFFVRCAFRLYDESLSMHTIPIYMQTATDNAVFLTAAIVNGGNYYWLNYPHVSFIAHELQYKFTNDLNDWSDVITSVDIFASAPIYTHDQDGKIEGLYFYPQDNQKNREGFWGKFHSVCSLDGGAYRPYLPPIVDYVIDASRPYDSLSNALLRIGNRTQQEIHELRDTESTFFLLKSIPIQEVKTDAFKTVTMKDGYLESLVNREKMTGDYRSNDKWEGLRLMSYNNRLHMGGVKFDLWKGQCEATVCNYVDVSIAPSWTWIGNYNTAEDSRAYEVSFEVTIEEDGKYFRKMCGELTKSSEIIPYFFYPNPNAKYLCIYIQASDKSKFAKAEIPLKKHPMLYGAYATDLNLYDFIDWKYNQTNLPTVGYNGMTESKSVLATSEVDNPFVFKAANISTVGDGVVQAMRSAAKPLSQGQYGQYPLYVFTSSGIFAMPVRDDGTYGVPAFVTSDVPTDIDAISAVDDSVFYPTDHGVKALTGSQSIVVSEALNALGELDVANLPHFDTLLANVTSETYKGGVRYRTHLETCKSIFDSRNNRVIFFSENDWVFHLVYNLKSKRWGTCPRMLKRALNTEQPYGISLDEKVIDISKIEDSPEAQRNSFIVTRPMKIGIGDMKKMRQIIAVGDFKEGHVKLVLWGSRNLDDWFLIGSSTTHKLRNLCGTGYKYYRLGMLLNLSADETVVGVRIEGDGIESPAQQQQ